jgi:hypothetical protein
MKATKKFFQYLLPVFVLSLFMLIIYGAYTPNRQASMQYVVCVKFTEQTTPEQQDTYMKELAKLRREVDGVIGFSAGRVVEVSSLNSGYDMIHTLTFTDEASVKGFLTSAAYEDFKRNYQSLTETFHELTTTIQK